MNSISVETMTEVGPVSIEYIPGITDGDEGADKSDYMIRYENWNDEFWVVPYLDRSELAGIRDAITRLLDITEVTP